MTERAPGVYLHPTADVSDRASIGPGTRVWHHVQIREGARLGADCIVGKGAYLDAGVAIGSRVKIQNGVSVYHGATVEDGVFLGPGAMLLNDRLPRAITPEGALKSDADWTVSPTVIRYGASIGGGAIVLPGVTVGRFALAAAGAVVNRDVPDHGLVAGVPGRLIGWVCACASRLAPAGETWRCGACGRRYRRAEGGLVEAEPGTGDGGET